MSVETTSTTAELPVVNQCSFLRGRELIFVTFLIVLACLIPNVILIPGESSLSKPFQYRRNQDFSISSTIEFPCNDSFPVTSQWSIKNCTSICSFEMPVNDSVITTLSELYIPGRTLPYGLYQLTLLVRSISSLNLSFSSSVYVQINPTGITANLIELGTSMITRGDQQDLHLDPGSYSADADEDSFNATVNKTHHRKERPRQLFSL